jgi:hypothetical protein
LECSSRWSLFHTILDVGVTGIDQDLVRDAVMLLLQTCDAVAAAAPVMLLLLLSSVAAAVAIFSCCCCCCCRALIYEAAQR